MKTLFILFCFLLLTAASFSQDLAEKLSSVLYQAGKDIPSDRLFLHLDRNLYHPADTIRFQAYIRDSRTGVFGTESTSLYVLLINASHSTVDSARFRIHLAAVPGWLAIPADIATGDYSVLAFTSSDMNFSPEYAFSTPVRIDKLLRPKRKSSQGEQEKDSVIYQAPDQERSLDLRFLPEGGTFICGIRQRVAFNAVTSEGRTLEVRGEIKNQKGERICSFASDSYGPGLVEFTPEPGDAYFAYIAGEEFKGMKWPLPAAEKNGVSMRVSNRGNGLTDILIRGMEVEGKHFFLTITMNNVLVYSETITVDTVFRKRIQTDRLPLGTAYISLYDNDLNPVAERLIIINADKKMKVRVETSSKHFFRGDETELTISTADDSGKGTSSIISLAVIDSLSGYCNEIAPSDIESAYIYDRSFYENLPYRIRRQGLSSVDSKAMDLLLMTYGWRRFIPKEVQFTPETELANYDLLKIINPGPEKKGRNNIMLISDYGSDVITLPVDNKREAVLYYDSLNTGISQIMIMPDKAPTRNDNPVRVVFPENNNYISRAKLMASYPGLILPDMVFKPSGEPDLRLEGYIVIEPVTIKAPIRLNKPKVYVDKNSRIYQSSGATTYYSRDFGPAFTFEDILYRFNPAFMHSNSMSTKERGKYVYLRNTSSYINGGHVEEQRQKMVFVPDTRDMAALIVLDNTQIGNSYETISELPASEIASVTFLRGPQGFAMYGNKAAGGVVFVTTKMGTGHTVEEFDRMYGERRNDDLMRQIRLFRTETEFYIPTKEQVTNDPAHQFRSTILWKDGVFIDSTGTVKVRYPNNLTKGTALVFVNGISLSNLVGTGRLSYKVN